MVSVELFGHGHIEHKELSLTSDEAEELAKKHHWTTSRGSYSWYFWSGRHAFVQFGQNIDKKEIKRMLSLQKRNKQLTSTTND